MLPWHCSHLGPELGGLSCSPKPSASSVGQAGPWQILAPPHEPSPVTSGSSVTSVGQDRDTSEGWACLEPVLGCLE